MGVRHTEFPLEGWQFHPESFLTEPGIELLKTVSQLVAHRRLRHFAEKDFLSCVTKNPLPICF